MKPTSNPKFGLTFARKNVIIVYVILRATSKWSSSFFCLIREFPRQMV